MMKNDVPILFGRFLSPYVRRVSISLNILGISFEHSVISAVDDEEKREAVNPVGRVPALQLENGKILIESSAILDHYDEAVGPARALVR
jgi:glutathione S-transferase